MLNDRERPIAVDLFAGVGGLSLGFEQAGFDVVVAVELDPVHACAHQFNFPRCGVVPLSIRAISGEDIRKAAYLSPSKTIDIVIGGAPCQGFSAMGPRSINDPRNSLVKEFIRLVRELRPLYFLFENVKGLTVERNLPFLKEIIQEVEEAGYAIQQPWKVLNARDYGVPQSRERLFLLGARKDQTIPNYPLPSALETTCAHALDDLPDAEAFEQLLFCDEVQADYLREPTGYSALMRCSDRTQWRYGYRRAWNPHLLTSSRRTNHTKVSRDRFEHTFPGKREPISHFFKLSPSGVSNTLRAGTDSSRGAFTSPRPIHYRYNRCVTVREMARLHGFPDWFRFNETKWHGGRQVGNSVPPPLAYAIAREFMRLLPYEPSRPDEVLALGSQQLLKVNMSLASAYWGIKTPIGGRDRQSIQRKRKQSDLLVNV